jgi:hypothetical protein
MVSLSRGWENDPLPLQMALAGPRRVLAGGGYRGLGKRIRVVEAYLEGHFRNHSFVWSLENYGRARSGCALDAE